MSERCFRVWGESIKGSKTMWNHDWLFWQRPVRNSSKRTSIHHPRDLLVRWSLFSAFLSILSSISVAQDPTTVGQWSAKTTWPLKPVHAALLPTGKVMWWPSFENGDNPTLWDPATGRNTALPKVGANIFCAGFSFLPGGELFVADTPEEVERLARAKHPDEMPHVRYIFREMRSRIYACQRKIHNSSIGASNKYSEAKLCSQTYAAIALRGAGAEGKRAVTG